MAKEAVDTRKLKDSVAEYLKKSKFDKAAELLEELAEAEPEDVQHQLRLGDCYRRLGEAVKSKVRSAYLPASMDTAAP